MNITITGATGFIGRRLIERLGAAPHQLHVLSRRTNINFGDTAVWITKWDPLREDPPDESIVNADAIVHLAGEPVARRWTPEAKNSIRASRVVHAASVHALSAQSHRHRFWLRVGGRYFWVAWRRGPDGVFRVGNDYLAEVCQEWEKQAATAESLGIRVARIRTGVVLGKGGGALKDAAAIQGVCRRENRLRQAVDVLDPPGRSSGHHLSCAHQSESGALNGTARIRSPIRVHIGVGECP
jgi:NAD dependent epimerase/dehydratase family enzyme